MSRYSLSKSSISRTMTFMIAPGLCLNAAVLAEKSCVGLTPGNIADGENHNRGAQSQQLFGRFEIHSSAGTGNDDELTRQVMSVDREGIDFRLDDIAHDGCQSGLVSPT